VRERIGKENIRERRKELEIMRYPTGRLWLRGNKANPDALHKFIFSPLMASQLDAH
jgi:hypothetical protein